VLLRALIALSTVALLVVVGLSGEIAAWLPHSTVFVVAFVCAAVAFVFWMHRLAGRLRDEEPRGPSNAHFASSPRTKRRHRRRRRRS
jgi:hypothetical protein